jgi:hypothetical protein
MEKEMRRLGAVVSLLVAAVLSSSAIAANINVTYNINTDVNRAPISKYIYGTNTGGDSNYTIVRSGGNRLTAYNWENNFSNAGHDWWWINDNYMSSSMVPGKAITDFRDSCVTNKQASIVTLQMAGYVSADKNGYVDCNTQAAPSSRFKKVVFAKGAPFCNPPGNPDGNDPNVYMDEFVNFLVSKYGHAGEPNGVKFYCMDNEPDLWYETAYPHATHWEVHPYMTNCAEYKDKSVAISTAIKNVDPNAQMLGPVSYGFNGYLSFQDACDWSSTWKYQYTWFLDYYLAKMDANSDAAGKRLLDALDVHWYPEANDGAIPNPHRILDSSINTTEMYNARMQAPRTLWDPTYREKSWIADWYRSYLPILPRLKSSINTYYPDTNLAITEYNYGAQTHWSGGIATADVLGIFGKYGVYIANYWFDSGPAPYVNAAIKMYTNYDGAKSTFGDTEVNSIMSDKVNSSIYASMFEGNDCQLHLIVINKNFDSNISGTFAITSPQNFTSGRAWRFNSSSYNITETTPINSITGNSFTYNIPALTVCHIVLQADCPVWDLSGPDENPDCRVDIYDLDAFADKWLNPYDFIDFAGLALEWGL